MKKKKLCEHSSSRFLNQQGNLIGLDKNGYNYL